MIEKLKQTEKFYDYKEDKDLPEWTKKLAAHLEKMYSALAVRINFNIGQSGYTTWDPGSIADGDEEAKEVTVTNAVLGDFAIASFSLDVADLTLNAQVTAAGVVTCVLANNTGGAIDLGSGTLRAKVMKK